MRFRDFCFRSLPLFFLAAVIPFQAHAKQEKKAEEEKPAYVFTIDSQVPHSPVKNQYHTGTCWCFATISFLESELLRMGKENMDLSEMFIVRHTYPHKAASYVRLHGHATFGQGGQSHDVFDQIRRYGIVPESVYPGMKIHEKRHNHGEMFAVLQGMIDAVIQNHGSRVTPRWREALEAVLDVYLGKPPESFRYKGKTYTPKTFAKEYLGLQTNPYVELTSFTHHPFYERCRLEVPDNWTFNDQYINVPIDDLERIADYALKNGYSVDWDGDVSERDFSTRKTGYGIIPKVDWEDKTEKQRQEKITQPVEEKEVTQEMRQETFNNYTTTDDHLMHIVGLAHDQKGTKFYYTKNSAGTDRKYDGYVYLSRSYFRLKTIAITVHQDAIPTEIKKKFKLQKR